MEKINFNPAPATPIITPSFSQALAYWSRLGWVSFGGPAAQIAMMQYDLVQEKRWIDDKNFLHALQYCLILPGPEAQQLAIYLGWRLHGIAGGLAAGILFILPAFFLLTLLAWLYLTFADFSATKAILYGIQPVVVALIFLAVWRLSKKILNQTWLWLIAIATFFGIFILPFPALLIVAAGFGMLQHWQNMRQGLSNNLINNELLVSHKKSPRFPWVKLLTWSLSIWVLLFAIAFALGGFFFNMAWFFTSAALLTFGGAYAVLPYVLQAAVYHYQWITPTQMLHALAFGESTPGPLIMVLTFVAFIGGWQAAPSLGLLPWQSGLIAATVATLFTFFPSFIFIFFGAPFIEKSKEIKILQLPMTAISAAVIGMIAYLGLYLAKTVFWQNYEQYFDWLALAFAFFAWFFLIKKVNIIMILLFFSSLGLLLKL